MRRRAVVNAAADPDTLGAQLEDKMPVTPVPRSVPRARPTHQLLNECFWRSDGDQTDARANGRVPDSVSGRMHFDK